MPRVTKIPRTIKTAAAAVAAETVPASPTQRKTLPVIVVLAVLLCLSVGIAGYFYYQYHNTPQEKEAKEIAALTKTIGNVFDLPTDETPTLATVTDKEKLADQPFFRKSENGDKVLIYTNSGRAILYRPSTKKIVDVTIVNVNQQPTANSQQPTTSPTEPAVAPVTAPTAATVALYNGSTKIGVTNVLEDEIKAKVSDVNITKKDKAAKTDYAGTLVVDLSGKNAVLAKTLAETAGGTVGSLPDGETNPGTDLLVIVGNK